MFSSGSFCLLSSSLVGVFDAAFSPSAAGFLSAVACGVAEFAPVVFFERSPLLVCAISRPDTPSIIVKRKSNFKSVFIGQAPAVNRKADRESYRKCRAFVQAATAGEAAFQKPIYETLH